jgi:hypothetical protein
MSKYASGGDLAQLLAALRGARDPWSRIKLVASGARALGKLTPGQRMQLLRQLGLEGAEELAEAAVGGDPRMSDAMTQALRALEADPRRAQQLVAAIADPSSRRATLMGLGAHVLEAVTAPEAQQAAGQVSPAKARGGDGGALTRSTAVSSSPQPTTPSSAAQTSSRAVGAVGAAAGAAATRAQGGAAAARQAREARPAAVQPTMPGTPHPGVPQPSTPQPPQPSTPLPPVPGTPPVPPPSTPQPPQPSTPPPSTPMPPPSTPAPPATPPSTPIPGPPTTAIAASPAEAVASPEVTVWEPTASVVFAEPAPPLVALDLSALSSPRATALATLRAWHRRLASDDPPRTDDAATLLAQQLRPGWAKRRALAALFAKQQPAEVDDALSLVAQLGNAADRRWLLCDLAASRPWADDDWQRLLAVASGPAERRRLAMRRERA